MEISQSLWQVSEVMVSYHTTAPLTNLPRITCSKDAENIFRTNWSNDIELLEEFNALFLNRANQVKGLFRLSRGGLVATVVDIKILFGVALKGLATGIIVAHNHPSGNLQISQADINLTNKIKEAGQTLDIPLLDHLILAPHGGYFSFADDGKI